MHVSSITDKGNGTVNEDSLLRTPHTFGIFDGATGLIKYSDKDGNTGGLIASRLAKSVFEKDEDKPFIESVKEISEILREKMKDAHIDFEDKGSAWTTSVSVVRVGETTVEYMQLGDSPIVFVYKDGTIEFFATDHDEETLLLWKSLAEEGVIDIRHHPEMEEQLLNVRRQSNVSHGTLNGDPRAVDFILQGTVDRESLKTIFLFSDGAMIPKADPSQPDDFEKLVSLFQENGLDRVRDYVRELEDSDPQCLKYPRFKIHDDLTAIAISF